jgi:2-keto-4-pentenoate hydratase/2-oxohepta-3-ene-1,7-dioic acid hydratase in catechol pathway
MRMCTFETKSRFGVVQRIGMQTPGGRILDLNLAYALTLAESQQHPRAYELSNELVPPDMLEFLMNDQFGRDAVNEALAHLGPRADAADLVGPSGEQLVYHLEEARLLAPLPRPNSIRDCLVFEEHLKNSMGGQTIPPAWYEIPVYYKGNPDTVAGPGDDVVWPSYTQLLDYELEFAAVIGRQGVDIPKEEAWDYIAGYTIFNDVSARDVQMKEMSCLLGPAKGKDMDGGNVMGPFLVTPDEFDPRRDNVMVARVNGEEWSRGVTSAMYHDFATIVSYISQGETLHVGDVIGSGTVGTGCGLELKRFPQPGDLIDLEVEGLGVLTNRFVNP